VSYKIPAMKKGIYQRIGELEEEGIDAVVITIVAAEGPVPREVGAKMIVYTDGKIEGTVGGGALEKKAIEEALKILQGEERTRLCTYNLEELGMICGGRATLYYERLLPPITLHIFGAGHVGEKLFALAKEVLPFRVAIYDVREEARQKVSALSLLPSYGEVPALKDIDYAFICTHSHQEDYHALKAILSSPTPPCYVGLVGSRPKWAKIRERLLAEGIPPDKLARVHCPVGLPLGGKDPEAIAVSTLAEILAHHHGKLEEARARVGKLSSGSG